VRSLLAMKVWWLGTAGGWWMGSCSYENGIPATTKAIKSELKEGEGDRPKLVLPTTKPKELKG